MLVTVLLLVRDGVTVDEDVLDGDIVLLAVCDGVDDRVGVLDGV